MSLISVPFFKTDKTEKLAAADSYDITDSRPINKVYDAAKQGASKIYDAAGGARGIGAGIQNLVTAKMSGATGKQMLEQGLGMFGTSTMGILKTAGNGIFDKAAEFIDMNPETVAKVKGTGEQLFNRLQYGDPSDLSNYGELATLIGGLTGQEQFAEYANMGIESAVWGSALTKSIEYGQYNYIGDVKQYIDPAVYKQALVYSVPMVSSSGSLEAVKELMKELTPTEILANTPDFIKTFLTQFKTPPELTVTREAYAADLVATLNLISPGWYMYQRQPDEAIVDMSLLAVASPDALSLFELYPALSIYAIAAPTAPEQTVEEVIRRQFPLMVTNLT
ncbi:hypothetical protein D3C80_34530 [compost metagenome]